MPFNIFEYTLYNYIEDHGENIEDIKKIMEEFNSIKWEVVPQ